MHIHRFLPFTSLRKVSKGPACSVVVAVDHLEGACEFSRGISLTGELIERDASGPLFGADACSLGRFLVPLKKVRRCAHLSY